MVQLSSILTTYITSESCFYIAYSIVQQCECGGSVSSGW